ncbi:AAA family ATPase [Haliscomenobacter sp.]|uniref:AAA family ATPase n=1 Tax=Haliscomenobacter sp. TaxID=2717303 RepID=UPI00359344F9
MYIKKVSIQNIRSIDHFEMEFEEPAGWHVVIGDNGSGKSSVVRAISLCLIGPRDAQALRLPLIDWIRKGENEADVSLSIQLDSEYDMIAQVSQVSLFHPTGDITPAKIKIFKEFNSGFELGKIKDNTDGLFSPTSYVWSGEYGWFSAAFGPFRRFTGGEKEWSKVYRSNPKAAAHLSIFGEDVALTESIEWLSHMKFQSLEKDKNAINILEAIKKFINAGNLLPNGVIIHDVTSEGVFFKDSNSFQIDVTQLSDGYRSMLSMLFELIRQLVKTYGEARTFDRIRQNDLIIDLAGVVLIDEVDAHLHPSWQTRIGQWFTKYFPNIQFIVTTHSPLVCRACEKGSIWHLAAPGSDEESGEITGIARKRLIYGNILDAYGTEAFGDNVSISEDAALKRNRLGELYEKSMLGLINKKEELEFEELKAILPTFKVNAPKAQ